MITRDINLVEKGLTVICSNVPINEKATLDILCHDSNGQLVIVQLSVDEDDIMLLHGIQSMDYVDKFKSFLKATYSKYKIDDKEKPRLILIAPSFSSAMRQAVESMKGTHERLLCPGQQPIRVSASNPFLHRLRQRNPRKKKRKRQRKNMKQNQQRKKRRRHQNPNQNNQNLR